MLPHMQVSRIRFQHGLKHPVEKCTPEAVLRNTYMITMLESNEKARERRANANEMAKLQGLDIKFWSGLPTASVPAPAAPQLWHSVWCVCVCEKMQEKVCHFPRARARSGARVAVVLSARCKRCCCTCLTWCQRVCVCVCVCVRVRVCVLGASTVRFATMDFIQGWRAHRHTE